jgi:hypothetical protein
MTTRKYRFTIEGEIVGGDDDSIAKMTEFLEGQVEARKGSVVIRMDMRRLGEQEE